jgi:hypothetical protein
LDYFFEIKDHNFNYLLHATFSGVYTLVELRHDSKKLRTLNNVDENSDAVFYQYQYSEKWGV